MRVLAMLWKQYCKTNTVEFGPSSFPCFAKLASHAKDLPDVDS